MGFPGGSVVKNLPANTGDAISISGLGRCPGGGHGNPLQYSCLENLMDRAGWWATVHRVTKSQTQLKRLSSSSSSGGFWPILKPGSAEVEMFLCVTSLLKSIIHSQEQKEKMTCDQAHCLVDKCFHVRLVCSACLIRKRLLWGFYRHDMTFSFFVVSLVHLVKP